MPRTQIVVSARDMASTTFRRISLSAKGLTDKIFSLKSAFIGAATGGIAMYVREAVRATDAIGKTADKIGLTTDQLQELRYAAELAGVGQKQLDMGMQRFSRRLGEVAQGTGELKKTAEQYGVQLYDNEGRMRSNVDLLQDWSDVIRNAKSDQEALRIAFKLFDSEGAALVNMLRGGAAALNETRSEAHALGLVIDEDLIRRSADANDAMSRLSMIVDTRFKATLVELAPEIIAASDGMAEWVRENKDFLTQDVPDHISDIASKVGEITTSLGELGSAWGDLPDDARNVLFGGGLAAWLVGMRGTGALAGAYGVGKGVEVMTDWRQSLDQDKESWTWAVTEWWNSMFDSMGLGASDDVKAVTEHLKGTLSQRNIAAASPDGLRSFFDQDRQLFDGEWYPQSSGKRPVETPSGGSFAEEYTEKQIKLREDMAREIQRLTKGQYDFERAEVERQYAKDVELAGKKKDLLAQAAERRRLSLASIAEEEAKAREDELETALQSQKQLTREIERATLDQYEFQRREAVRYYDDLKSQAEAAGRETATIEAAKVARLAEINKTAASEAARSAQQIAEENKQALETMRQAEREALASSERVMDGIRLGLMEYNDTVVSTGRGVADALRRGLESSTEAIRQFLHGEQAEISKVVNAIIADIERMLIRQAIVQPIAQAALGTFGGFAGFADGGISHGPQLAWVSEGRYAAEAHVPLPDGRSIPVTMQGGTGSPTSVTVDTKVEVINQTGSPVNAKAEPTANGIRLILKSVAQDAANGGVVAQGIQAGFKVQKRVR